MKRFFLVLALALLISKAPFAFADQEALSCDAQVVSENQEYVFVYFALTEKIFREDSPQKDRELRKKYPESGLYRKNDSQTPLWKFHEVIDWPIQAYVASDGKHLAVVGPWPRLWNEKDMEKGGAALNQPALLFYGEGRPLKSYLIGDLAQDAKMFPRTASHFQWKKDIKFDDQKGRLFVETHDGQKLVFNVVTGDIIERTHP